MIIYFDFMEKNMFEFDVYVLLYYVFFKDNFNFYKFYWVVY